MADLDYKVFNGVLKKLRDMGDGTYAEVVAGSAGAPGSSDTTEATQLLVKTAVEAINTKTGALTETAPATDTASSGINGRLQRIAQRVTSLIALVPTALTASGNYKTATNELNVLIAGEDIDNDVLKVESRYSFANITTQTSTVVKSGPGLLKRIIFGQALASGVVAIYDNTAGSGTLITTITFPATLLNNVACYNFDCAVATGLTIVTSGATQNITAIYR